MARMLRSGMAPCTQLSAGSQAAMPDTGTDTEPGAGADTKTGTGTVRVFNGCSGQRVWPKSLAGRSGRVVRPDV